MTSTAIWRQRLITNLSGAGNHKIKAIFTLLEREINDGKNFHLSEKHLQILDKQRSLHLNGTTNSYSKAASFDIIKGITKL